MNERVLAILCLALLSGLPACSSSSGPSQEQLIEADVSAVVGFLGQALAGLNPFNPAPAANAPSGIPGCTDVSLPAGLNCEPGTGPIQECPSGGADINVEFNSCVFATMDGSVEVDGTAVYSPGQDWPRGSRVVRVVTTDTDTSYDVTLTGTSQVTVHYTDNITGAMADCTSDLETAATDCAILPPPI